MSNYALQSQLNQLERELRQVQQYNSELRGELSTVANGVDRAHRDLEDYNTKIRNTLDNCNGSILNVRKIRPTSFDRRLSVFR